MVGSPPHLGWEWGEESGWDGMDLWFPPGESQAFKNLQGKEALQLQIVIEVNLGDPRPQLH